MMLSAWLGARYYAWRPWLPERLLYHRDFFRVLALLGLDPAVRTAQAKVRLRHILVDALAHVPYYRRTVPMTVDEARHEPLAEVFASFPMLSKEAVMAEQRAFLDERFDPGKLLYATSGGSSGQGIGMWRSKRVADIEKAFFTHEWGKYGFSFSKARTLRIGADARRLAHESPWRIVGNRLMLSPYHINDKYKDAIAGAIRRFRPAFVHAYPSSAAALAELLSPVDIETAPKAVLLASEPATSLQLAAIARLFRCPISVNYGLCERTNLAFASHVDGVTSPYDFHSLYSWSENLLAEGRAEIVGTSLWNDVMPLIRYRTGDFGLIEPDGRCAAIDGRGHEFLVDRYGNHIPGLAIVIDESTWDFVRLYQVRQYRPGAISLAVVGRHGPLSPAQKGFLHNAQRRRWGGFFDIDIEEESDIPLGANGKRRLVVGLP